MGKGSPIKTLRRTYVAKAGIDKIKRSNGTLGMTMPGNPLIATEGQILTLGFQVEVAGL